MIDNNSPAPPRETEDDGNNAEAVRHELRRVERWLRQVQAQLDDARRARDCAKAALAEIAAALAASEDARRKAEAENVSLRREITEALVGNPFSKRIEELSEALDTARAELEAVRRERDEADKERQRAVVFAKAQTRDRKEAEEKSARAEAALATAWERAEEICRKHGEHHRRGGSDETIVNACLYLAGRMKYERAALAAAPRAGETVHRWCTNCGHKDCDRCNPAPPPSTTGGDDA
jgi:chromosome segregation ATPase